MVKPADFPANVDVHIDGKAYDAVPLSVRGDEASLILSVPPWGGGTCELVLGWDDGRVTSLAGHVRAIESNGRVHLDLDRIEGDWRPFLEYLGAALA